MTDCCSNQDASADTLAKCDALSVRKRQKKRSYHLILHCAAPLASETASVAPRITAKLANGNLGSILAEISANRDALALHGLLQM